MQCARKTKKKWKSDYLEQGLGHKVHDHPDMT